MKQQQLLANGKCRRRYTPEHSLFAAGNELRAIKFYQESYGKVVMGETTGEIDAKPIVFACRLFNCNNVGFYSLRAYEEHYDLLHRNICRECFRSFLSYRLLDIHLSETHDAFFRVLSQRKPMYVCLVDGCAEVFTCDDKRTKHLVHDHQYPATFSFHRPRGMRRHKQMTKTAAAMDRDVRNMKKTAGQESKMAMMTDEQIARAGEIKMAKAKARKEKRRMKKKQGDPMEQAQPIPAENMDMEVCSHHHEEEESTPLAIPVDTDMQDKTENKCEEDEDLLVEQMKNLQLPKTISFGRRQQHRHHR